MMTQQNEVIETDSGWSSAILEQKFFCNSNGEVFCIDILASNAESWHEEIKEGWQEISNETAVLMTTPPDSYHSWSGEAWVLTDENSARKQADEAAAKQSEITALLTLAAQRISEYQDLLDFSETPEEAAAGEAGYNAWRQYRASLLKYQKGLIADMPLQPE